MNPFRPAKRSPLSDLLLRAASISCANALFQVVALRLLVRGPLLHARLAVSLMAGLALLWLGLGAAAALPCKRWARLVDPFAGVTTALAGIAVPLILGLPSARFEGPTLQFWLSFACISLPLCLMGVSLGIVYQSADTGQKGVAGKLVASGTLGFIFGFVLSGPLLLATGVFPALVLCAVLLALPSRPLLGAGTVAVATALVLVLGLHRDLERFAIPKAHFWQDELAAEHEHLLGGWSPYSRVDFYRTPSDCLAGVYNGSQQWMSCPQPEQDFEVRRALYPTFDGEVLLIGAGGGQGLVHMQSASRVVAVELDPFVVGSMKGPLAAYNARSYLKHRVVAGDGRSYLDGTGRRFDAIVFEGTDVAVSRLSHSVISFESTLFTREGLARAASRLTNDGLLLAMHTQQLAPTARFLRGLPPGFHARVWEGVTVSPLTKFPFVMAAASRSRQALERVSRVAEELRYPQKPLEAYAGWTPIGDERPFLYYTSRDELTPLYLFAGAAFLVLVSFFAWIRPRPLTGYFALIGIGFMVLELYLLASYRSALGGYSDTYAAVMGSLALSSAAGSLYWERIGKKGAVIATAGGLFLTAVCTRLLGSLGDLAVLRLLLLCLGTAPVGFAAGLFMPAGLSRAAGRGAAFLAVDALGTAAGFALFYCLALDLGFPAALAVSCLFYGGALYLWPTGFSRA